MKCYEISYQKMVETFDKHIVRQTGLQAGWHVKNPHLENEAIFWASAQWGLKWAQQKLASLGTQQSVLHCTVLIVQCYILSGQNITLKLLVLRVLYSMFSSQLEILSD